MSALRRGIVGIVTLGAALVAPAAIAVAPASIALGDVSSEVVRDDVDLSALLRSNLERELPGVDLRRALPRQVILTASLVRMDAEESPQKATVTCVVSAMLIDVKRGTVVAILEGRARAENAAVAPSLERAAMSGAVKSALARVPEAMK